MNRTYIITLTEIGPRGGIRGSDSYKITDEDLEGKWAASFKALIITMAYRAVYGKSALPLPTDDDDDENERS